METPLCGRSGGHAGTAPTVSFGWIARGTVNVVWVDCVWTVGFVWVDCAWVVILFVWIVCKWSFYLCGIAWKIMMEFGRGGAYVPARVAP